MLFSYRRSPFSLQFLRFCVVGTLNTLVDFAVLNGLIFAFGLTAQDSRYLFYKGLAFIVSVVHSFFWNKYWVFQEKGHTRGFFYQGMIFLLISAVALGINTLVSYSFFYFATIFFPSFSTFVVANGGAFLGTVVVLFFNYMCYKLIIFKIPHAE